MKKYKLKKWYPSLLKDVRVGDIITENGQHYKGVTYKGISYRVDKEFCKIYMCASNPNVHPGIIRFSHESNADEYIWKNKPLFSYEDIFSYLPTGSDIGVIEQLAKERI